jgi:hypothetical protein
MNSVSTLFCFGVVLLEVGRMDDTIDIVKLDVYKAMNAAAALPHQATVGRLQFCLLAQGLGLG